MSSILSNKNFQFQSSEQGIRCITKQPVSALQVGFIYGRLLKELEAIGYTITFHFTIYRKDSTANMNFTVYKEGCY